MILKIWYSVFTHSGRPLILASIFWEKKICFIRLRLYFWKSRLLSLTPTLVPMLHKCMKKLKVLKVIVKDVISERNAIHFMGQMEHFFSYPNIGPRITIVMAILILPANHIRCCCYSFLHSWNSQWTFMILVKAWLNSALQIHYRIWASIMWTRRGIHRQC